MTINVRPRLQHPDPNGYDRDRGFQSYGYVGPGGFELPLYYTGEQYWNGYSWGLVVYNPDDVPVDWNPLTPVPANESTYKDKFVTFREDVAFIPADSESTTTEGTVQEQEYYKILDSVQWGYYLFIYLDRMPDFLIDRTQLWGESLNLSASNTGEVVTDDAFYFDIIDITPKLVLSNRVIESIESRTPDSEYITLVDGNLTGYFKGTDNAELFSINTSEQNLGTDDTISYANLTFDSYKAGKINADVFFTPAPNNSTWSNQKVDDATTFTTSRSLAGACDKDTSKFTRIAPGMINLQENSLLYQTVNRLPLISVNGYFKSNLELGFRKDVLNFKDYDSAFLLMNIQSEPWIAWNNQTVYDSQIPITDWDSPIGELGTNTSNQYAGYLQIEIRNQINTSEGIRYTPNYNDIELDLHNSLPFRYLDYIQNDIPDPVFGTDWYYSYWRHKVITVPQNIFTIDDINLSTSAFEEVPVGYLYSWPRQPHFLKGFEQSSDVDLWLIEGFDYDTKNSLEIDINKLGLKTRKIQPHQYSRPYYINELTVSLTPQSTSDDTGAVESRSPTWETYNLHNIGLLLRKQIDYTKDIFIRLQGEKYESGDGRISIVTWTDGDTKPTNPQAIFVTNDGSDVYDGVYEYDATYSTTSGQESYFLNGITTTGYRLFQASGSLWQISRIETDSVYWTCAFGSGTDLPGEPDIWYDSYDSTITARSRNASLWDGYYDYDLITNEWTCDTSNNGNGSGIYLDVTDGWVIRATDVSSGQYSRPAGDFDTNDVFLPYSGSGNTQFPLIKTVDVTKETNNVYNAFRLMTETYANIAPEKVNYNNLETERTDWNVGRQINKQQNIFNYIRELCKQSFVVGWVSRTGTINYKAFREEKDATPSIRHDSSIIIKNSIKGFKQTPITKVYNNLSIDYDWDECMQRYTENYSINFADSDAFPESNVDDSDGNPLWYSYVPGFVSSYADAKVLWEKTHSAYLETKVINKLPSDISQLQWAGDKTNFYQDLEYDKTEEYAYKYLNLSVDWNTRQKLIVNYEIPITEETLTLDLMDQVSFQDDIITGESSGVGWITKLDLDPKMNVFKVELTFEKIKSRWAAECGDIVERSTNTDTIVEDSANTDDIIEGACS